jgi:DNA-binding NtrC family response regulator
MTSVDARRIMIVDEDDCVREGMEMALEVTGHHVRSTRSGPDALRWLEDEPCDLLIVDFNMPEMDGPALYRRVHARWPTSAPRVLFVSGHGKVSRYVNDPEVLAVPLLVKPFSLDDLLAAVTRALETPEPCRILIDTGTWTR